MRLKRSLYLVHRWLGIGMCLLMSMWFLSGVVLMYVHFPALTPAERLQGLPVLEPATVQESPEPLLAGSALRSLTLTTVVGRPAWLAQNGSGSWAGLFADSGASLEEPGAAGAEVAARSFLASRGQRDSRVGSIDLIEMDQWTVSGSLNAHRPLYKVRIEDAPGTVLYVSSRTGQVVRDTARAERAWNWLGANLHWIYPLALRRHPEVWHWVIVILSSIGLVSILTGAVIGVTRLRPKRPYRGRDWTPYRGIMKWHHVLGLVCSVFLFTFMLSGLFSMNPFGVFTPPVDYRALPMHYRGAAPERFDAQDMEVLRRGLRETPGAKEIRWHWLQGDSYPVLVRNADDYRILSRAGPRSTDGLESRVTRAATSAISPFDGDARLVSLERLEDYDSYYYSHAGRWRPLPILRLRFDDPGRSWLHVDARTGELLSHMTSHDRTERWWYHGLHSLDFTVLINNRPVWDLVMIALSTLGFALTVTSVMAGWRRIRPRRRQRLPQLQDSEA